MFLPKQFIAFLGLMASLRFFGPDEDVPVEEITAALQKVPWIPNDFDIVALFAFFEDLAIGAFFAQALISAIFLKLAWELHWYMVGDEFLRIRQGIWWVHEQTMTVARIQNMEVRRGPIQKFFGIADLEVHTAGGGSAGDDAGDKEFHIARFRGLEDASGLRDQLRERLIRHRKGGLTATKEPLGEPSDAQADEPGSKLAAARALRDEARALREALGQT